MSMNTDDAGAERERRVTQEDLVEIDRNTLVDEDRTVAPVYRTLRPGKVHQFEAMQRARTQR